MFIFVYVGIILIVILQIYIFKSLQLTRKAIREIRKGKRKGKRRRKKIVLSQIPKKNTVTIDTKLLNEYTEPEKVPETDDAKSLIEYHAPEIVQETINNTSLLEYSEPEKVPETVSEPVTFYINMQETGPKCLLEEFRSNEIALRLDSLIKNKKKYMIPDLKIQDVADELGVNRTYLSYAINKTYNQNFKSYLNQLRFEMMNELILMKSDRNYEDIAIKCGFGSVDTLRRVVRSKTGMNIGNYKTCLLEDIPIPPLRKSKYGNKS